VLVVGHWVPRGVGIGRISGSSLPPSTRSTRELLHLRAIFASLRYDTSMDLSARVNILDGRAVRLPRGDVHDAIALHNDPLGRINNWFQQGADHVHVVDLDAAAFGDDKNRYLIDRILDEATGQVQVAGGIRSHVEAARLLEQGAWRIVMG